MGMKPPLGDRALPIGNCSSTPKDVNEFGNIPGTVSTLKQVQDRPIPGTASQKESPKSSTVKGR
jgi:hypothetical protein